MHINAIGGDCPGKTELHRDILSRADTFVEYPPQTRIEGEIQQMDPDYPVTELWQVVTGQVAGRRTEKQITLFDSVGFAIEDFSALRYVRERVRGTSFYQPVDLIADPMIHAICSACCSGRKTDTQYRVECLQFKQTEIFGIYGLPMAKEHAQMNEVERLRVLEQYGILDTPHEEPFERIAALARLIFETPIVLISLVDDRRQWFKTNIGLDLAKRRASRPFATRQSAATTSSSFPTPKHDIRTARNPLVTGNPHIRFYAGAPLVTPEKARLGSLCVIDREPGASMIDRRLSCSRLPVSS